MVIIIRVPRGKSLKRMEIHPTHRTIHLNHPKRARAMHVASLRRKRNLQNNQMSHRHQALTIQVITIKAHIRTIVRHLPILNIRRKNVNTIDEFRDQSG